MQNSEYELPAAEGTPNGEVGASDLKQLQKEKQDLEQQLIEKNKVRTPYLATYAGSVLAQPSGQQPSCSSSLLLPPPQVCHLSSRGWCWFSHGSPPTPLPAVL